MYYFKIIGSGQLAIAV